MAQIVECQCGAAYEKTITKLPARDKDEFTCSECGEVLNAWNSSVVPQYRLIKTPNGGSA